MQKVKSVIKRPTSNYSQIPNELIYDKRFNSNKQSAMALRLLLYIFSKPDNWQFYRETVAEELGVSVPTLDRMIREAKELGWLDIQHADGKAVSRRPVWVVTIPEIDKPLLSEDDNDDLSDREQILSTADSQILSTVEALNNTVSSKTVNSKNITSSWTDDQCQKLIDTYNEYRGKLPEVRTASAKRFKSIRTLFNEYGYERALELVAAATQEVSKNDWWIKGRYNLDNLFAKTHLVKYAERHFERLEREAEDEEAPF